MSVIPLYTGHKRLRIVIPLYNRSYPLIMSVIPLYIEGDCISIKG